MTVTTVNTIQYSFNMSNAVIMWPTKSMRFFFFGSSVHIRRWTHVRYCWSVRYLVKPEKAGKSTN